MIEKYFRSLIGLPCWSVQYDCQTNLAMNFGPPHLEVREPYRSRSASARLRRISGHRRVTVRGRYWLWIEVAHWRLESPGAPRATDRSAHSTICRATWALDGQRLEGVEVDAGTGRTRFRFDLGATLDVWRPGRGAATGRLFTELCGSCSLWSLYGPRGRVLVVRGDGCFYRGPGDLPPGEEPWRPLAARRERGRGSGADGG